MAILTGFIIAIIISICSIGVVSYLWGSAEGALLPIFLVTLFLEVFIWLPFALGYTIRRGHDFWVPSYLSVIYVVISTVLYILPWIVNYLGWFGVYVGWLQLLIALVYIFYPGNKTSNIYGNPPIDTWKPKRILRYMKTGSWDN